MLNGEIVLAALPQADGFRKARPVLLVCELPGYGDWLTVGISSQLRQFINGWDIALDPKSERDIGCGLKCYSIIRLSFIATVPTDVILGSIGSVHPDVLVLVKNRFAEMLVKEKDK